MPTDSHLLLATTNPGKIRELSELLSKLHLQFRSLSDIPDVTEAAETGKTFEENAVIKARHYSRFAESWTLADDSGLEVEALGGAPGVFSARYLGKDASYSERAIRLLDELAVTGDPARRARFVCVVALSHPAEPEVRVFFGECKGSIAERPRGAGGFGYDPIFVPDGHSETFAEMSSELKHQLSHRARAIAKAHEFLAREIRSSA